MTMESSTTTKRPRKMAREPQGQVVDANIPVAVLQAAKLRTKASLVEELLQQTVGAALADLCQATGWQPHTCRAFLTGLRKKGRELERDRREDGTTIYRLAPIAVAA